MLYILVVNIRILPVTRLMGWFTAPTLEAISGATVPAKRNMTTEVYKVETMKKCELQKYIY